MKSDLPPSYGLRVYHKPLFPASWSKMKEAPKEKGQPVGLYQK